MSVAYADLCLRQTGCVSVGGTRSFIVITLMSTGQTGRLDFDEEDLILAIRMIIIVARCFPGPSQTRKRWSFNFHQFQQHQRVLVTGELRWVYAHVSVHEYLPSSRVVLSRENGTFTDFRPPHHLQPGYAGHTTHIQAPRMSTARSRGSRSQTECREMHHPLCTKQTLQNHPEIQGNPVVHAQGTNFGHCPPLDYKAAAVTCRAQSNLRAPNIRTATLSAFPNRISANDTTEDTSAAVREPGKKFMVAPGAGLILDFVRTRAPE